MNRRQWIILSLIAVCTVLIFSAAYFGWELDTLRGFGERWSHERPYTAPSFTLGEWPHSLFGTLAGFLTLYLSGVLVLFAFPNQVRHMQRRVEVSAIELSRLTALGLLSMIFVAAIGISSALAVSTFPLTIFLGSVLFLSAFFGLFALAYAVGHKLLAYADWSHLSPLFGLFLGLLILYAAWQIPYVNALFKILFVSLGLGLVIATRFGTGRGWNLAPLQEE